MTESVMVGIDNTKSGQSLFTSVNRADGPWLTLNSSNPAWQANFDNTCQMEVASGSNYVFPFIEYSGNFGARLFVSQQAITGAPNLSTADFIYDKVEMGWRQSRCSYSGSTECDGAVQHICIYCWCKFASNNLPHVLARTGRLNGSTTLELHSQ